MKNKRILIADDKEESRYLLTTLLQSQGYEVDTANHGAEALIKARLNPPILIISDLLMPVMDGYTLLRKWKADERLRSIPFIVYTATYTDVKDEHLAFDMGADDFILKPTEPEPFIVRVQKVLTKAEHGELSPVQVPTLEKEVIAKEYSEILIRKLEEKAFQLESANRVLQQDITERKQMEEAMSKSEGHLRSVVQTAGDAIMTMDAQGIVRLWNDAAEAMFGYSSAEMIGQPMNKILPERFRDRLQKKSKRPIMTGQLVLGQNPTEAFGLRRDGGEFPLEITISSWKVKEGIFSTAIIRDITERLRSEEALRKSEAQLSSAAIIAQLGPWEYDVEKDTYTFNDQFYSIFKTTASDVGGYALSSKEYARRFVHPDDIQFICSEIQKAVESPDPHYNRTVEHRILYADGTAGYLSVRFYILKDAQGKTVKTYGVGQDITERKRTEEAMRKRLRELEGMNRVSTTLRIASTLETMLPTLLDEALAMVESETGAIWLSDTDTGVLRRAAARGWFSALENAASKPGEGFPGSVYSSNEIYLSDEFAGDSNLRAIDPNSIPAGWGGVCIPIRSDKEPIGVLCISLQLPRKFFPEEVNLLVTLSEMAGTAIQRTRLNNQTKNQLERLSTLHSIDTAITASMNLDVTLGFFLDQVTDQLRVNAASILLCDRRLMRLEYIAGRGFLGNGISATRLQIGEGHAGRAALERELVHVADLTRTPLAHPERVKGEGFVSYTAAPLIAKGQVKGVLELFHRSRFSPNPDWFGFLKTLAGQAAIAIDNATLFSDLQSANLKLVRAYDATLEGWSRAMDLRDKETEGHSERVTATTLLLCRKMGIGDEESVHIRRGALLHDLGKLGVPDFILNKPAILTDEERDVMRKHPTLAYELLKPIEFLRPALDIPYCHHERWDGSGYPRGLKEEQIPLSARIFTVADVYDALTSDRPYRAAWSKDKALEYIRERSGKEFDPQVVLIFLPMEW